MYGIVIIFGSISIIVIINVITFYCLSTDTRIQSPNKGYIQQYPTFYS